MSVNPLQAKLKQQAIALFQSGKIQQAKEACLELCNKESSDPQVWYLLSTINGSLKLYEDAEQCAQRAVDLAPNYLAAHINLALSKLNQENIEAAKLGFENILSHQPDNAQVNYYKGLCYEKEAGQDQKAISYFEKALSHSAQSPKDWVLSLINAYERIGAIDESRLLVIQHLTANPNDSEVGLIKARNQANDGDLEGASGSLKTLLNNVKAQTIERARLLNQYGIVLDKLGECEQAFAAFTECQQIEKNDKPQFDGRRIFDKIISNTAAATTENTTLWQQNLHDDDLPVPVFLVGFPRSGTTLLERIISTHPDIFPSSEENIVPRVIDKLNEISSNRLVYPRNLNDVTKGQITQLRQEYWNQVHKRCRAIPEGQLFLDKAPLNLIELCFINRIFPEAKIIMVLRDPRDVCLSCFMQQFAGNDAMANFYDLDTTAKFYDATMRLYSHYKESLNLNVHTVRYEDVVADIETELRKLLDFVGLEWDEKVLSYSQNRKYKIKTPSYHDTCKPLFTSAIERWRRYDEHITPLLPMLQSHIDWYKY